MSGVKDKVRVVDYAQATIETLPVPPLYPCPKCGKEMLDHSVPRTRICSMEICRHVEAKTD